MNLQGAMELAMAAATAGLVMGAILGGPITEYLIKRHKLSGPAGAAAEEDKAGEEADAVTSRSLINTLFVVLACLAGGKFLARIVEGTGFIMPDFVFCLLLGVVIRNALPLAKPLKLSDRTVDVVGEVALSLFLVMALMTMKLLDLANLAGPLLVILALQALLMIAFSVFITYNVMGRNYDAAVISGGAGRLRPFVHGVRARDHEGRHRPPRRLRRRVPHRADGRRILHRHPERDGHPGLARAPALRFRSMRWLAIVLLIAGCSRGPDETALGRRCRRRSTRASSRGFSSSPRSSARAPARSAPSGCSSITTRRCACGRATTSRTGRA